MILSLQNYKTNHNSTRFHQKTTAQDKNSLLCRHFMPIDLAVLKISPTFASTINNK